MAVQDLGGDTSSDKQAEPPGSFVHPAQASTADTYVTAASRDSGYSSQTGSPADQDVDAQMNESLQQAALSLRDSDAASVSTLQSASEEDAEGQAVPSTPQANTSTTVDTSQDTRHQMDWNHFLGLSNNGLNAATSATSLGFAAARQTTAFGLNVARRFTQGLVALPAMAIDGAMLGNAPSMSNYNGQRGTAANNTPTIAEVAHAAVGGLFDVISTVALGGIDLGSAITGTSIGAAATGVEGIRRALGSEVLRSLGAFSRLVRREWNSTSEFLPPGGMPQYSIIGVTQALTAWVSIQMVTREWYERNMLKHLEPIDTATLEKELKDLHDAATRSNLVQTPSQITIPDDSAAGTPLASPVPTEKRQKKKVRIVEGEVLPGDEGEVIGAEIGQPSEAASASTPAPASAASFAADTASAPLPASAAAPEALTTAEAVYGLKRYSRLVLGVYGGVALAWLGSLPPDLMQAAGASLEQEAEETPSASARSGRASRASSQGSFHSASSRRTVRTPAELDEDDFLQAASTLDLDDDELIEDEAASIFSADAVFVDAHSSQTSSAATSGTATPSASTQDNKASIQLHHGPTDAGTSAAPTTETTPAQATGRSYSYYDILMGTADSHLFHQLGGLEHGAATEGDYTPADAHAESAAEHLRRVQNRVARPSKPRYYVVTDHTSKKVVLVLRGSLTLGDIAIDLTCESANLDFEHEPSMHRDSAATSASDDEDGPQPAEDFSKEAQSEKKAEAARKRETESQARPHTRSDYIVHEGMYETAKEVGDIGRPVHRAVKRALASYPDYDLDITGHSLGAGVAAMLAIMWASPKTGRTTAHSGLPAGRRTHAYCFGVPCVMGAKLGRLSAPLVTSFCYSYDLVCRLSLGAVLDQRNACGWLAYENSQPATQTSSSRASTASQPEHYGLARPLRLTNIIQRAFVHQSGQLNSHPQQKADIEADFLALRKTLQANMRHVELYPPGTVLYSLPDDDVLPHLQAPRTSGATPVTNAPNRGANDRLARTATLYRLRDNDDQDTINGARHAVFGEIINARGMLSRHMPHLYHAAIDGL